jgi:hypothetical protein
MWIRGGSSILSGEYGWNEQERAKDRGAETRQR